MKISFFIFEFLIEIKRFFEKDFYGIRAMRSLLCFSLFSTIDLVCIELFTATEYYCIKIVGCSPYLLYILHRKI